MSIHIRLVNLDFGHVHEYTSPRPPKFIRPIDYEVAYAYVYMHLNVMMLV